MSWGLVAVAGATIVGSVVGSKSNKDAQKASAAGADAASRETRRAADEARADSTRLFEQANQQSQKGFQGALGVFEDVVPQQSNFFQQGNINAQNTLLGGLSQQQNALLGGNVDLSQLQATQQFQPDFSFLNQQPPPIVPTETQPQSPMQGIVPPARFTGGVNFNPMDFSNMGGFRHNNMGRFR